MSTFVVFYSEKDKCYVAHEENHPELSAKSDNKKDALEEAKIIWEYQQVAHAKKKAGL